MPPIKGLLISNQAKTARKTVRNKPNNTNKTGENQKTAFCRAKCLVLAKVDTFMNNKKCVKQCERVQQSTAMSSN